MSEHHQNYFASINSSKGFKNFFPLIFDPNVLNQIFILKGGPGTGKSTLMKSIAQEAENCGETVEYFLCSSDPKSLDGILLTEKKIAIIDGTSPHVSEPSFPGVVENIINLGTFWDTKKLLPHKSRILSLIREKKNFYKRAYQFLAAYGEISEEILSFTEKTLNYEKMMRNIKVQTSYFFQKDKKSYKRIRNISTVSKDGYKVLNSFQELSNKIWVVEDFHFSAYLYLYAMAEYASRFKQAFYLSYSPQFPDKPNALYFPDSKTCFLIEKRDYDKEVKEKEYHYINMKRFLNLEKMASGKQKIKFGEKCLDSLFQGASEALEDAARCHEELERYYTSAMNYDKMDDLKQTILQQLTT